MSNNLDEKQVQRIFALYDSIKKLPESRYNEGLIKAKAFFKDNKMSTRINEIEALGKLKSKYKQKCIQSLLMEGKDIYNLYKFSYVKDSDVIKYLGIDKIKNCK